MGAHGFNDIKDMLHPLICRAKDKAIVIIIGNQRRLQVKCIKKGRADSGNHNKNSNPKPAPRLICKPHTMHKALRLTPLRSGCGWYPLLYLHKCRHTPSLSNTGCSYFTQAAYKSQRFLRNVKNSHAASKTAYETWYPPASGFPRFRSPGGAGVPSHRDYQPACAQALPCLLYTSRCV